MMSLLPKQKAKWGLIIIVYSTFLFSPSLSAFTCSLSSSSSSSCVPSYYDTQQKTEIQSSAKSNINIGNNTITFLTPEISISYPATWNALPGIPTSPYVDSIVTFTLPPEKNNTSQDSMATLNIAKHQLVDKVIELEEYVGTQLYFLRNTIPGFNVEQFNKTTLDGSPAYQAIYTGLEGPDVTKTMKLWVNNASTRYIVTYSTGAKSFPGHLESVREMISSLKITGAQAPPDLFMLKEGLDHIPESSKEKFQPFKVSELVLSSIFDNNLLEFMKGSAAAPPPNFTKLSTYSAVGGNKSISAYYYMTPTYSTPDPNSPGTKSEPYKLLVLLFKDNSSNNLVTGSSIDYKVSINNGTNLYFAETGSTLTGADIKVLNGTSFVEAVKNPQQYSISLDIKNFNKDLDNRS